MHSLNTNFETMIEHSIAKCTTLAPTEARHFLKHGWVMVKGSFPKRIAEDVVSCAWRALHHGEFDVVPFPRGVCTAAFPPAASSD